MNVSRLARARLRVLETLEEEMADLVSVGLTFREAERQLATEQLRLNAEWPEFFTTLRWRFGNAAEERLKEIAYNG